MNVDFSEEKFSFLLTPTKGDYVLKHIYCAIRFTMVTMRLTIAIVNIIKGFFIILASLEATI